jgi:hypothetical protein
MKLQELMHFEEKILLCEYYNKFVMPFADYIILDKLLSEVENITNLYFQLMDDFKKSINKENISNDERNQKLDDFNQKLLNEEVMFDFKEYDDFISKYNIEK